MSTQKAYVQPCLSKPARSRGGPNSVHNRSTRGMLHLPRGTGASWCVCQRPSRQVLRRANLRQTWPAERPHTTPRFLFLMSLDYNCSNNLLRHEISHEYLRVTQSNSRVAHECLRVSHALRLHECLTSVSE